MTSPLVTLDGPDEMGIATLALAHPPVNAMDLATYDALRGALSSLRDKPGVRCLLLTSAIPGRFCAGADRNELRNNSAALTTDAWQARAALVEAVIGELGDFPVPTIAVIDGYAVGIGLVLVSLCDLRVASNRAWFALPELEVERCGGARHALRSLPQAVVREMYFAGSRVSAEVAMRLGFLNRLVRPEHLDSAARSLAKSVATHSVQSLVMGKRALNLGEQMSVLEGHRLEQAYSFKLATGRDMGEDEP